MEHSVEITGRGGETIAVRNVPEGSWQADIVASEMAQVAQRAYDLGRAAEGAALETAIDAAVKSTRLEGHR